MKKDKKTLNTIASSNQGIIKKRVKKLTKWSNKSKSANERYLLMQLISFYLDQLEH